jgi:hypothetical protein
LGGIGALGTGHPAPAAAGLAMVFTDMRHFRQ